MQGMSREKWYYLKNLAVERNQRFVRCGGILYEVITSFNPTGNSPVWSVEEVQFFDAAPFVSTWDEPPSEKGAAKVTGEQAITDVPPAERFIVKRYAAEDRPIIKGNGFDGLEVGETREEAQAFVDWINARIA